LQITVPASSANLGPGFDSLGIALNKYIQLNIKEDDYWDFLHINATIPPINHYKHHYIYKAIHKIASFCDCKIPPCKIEIQSDIPLARGLGSSASAIISSVEIVNQMCKLNLTTNQKIQIATKIEPHYDNIVPALLGGLTITTEIDGNLKYMNFKHIKEDFIMYVPKFKIKTKESRVRLKRKLSIDKVAYANGLSNILISALISKDYILAGKMMESDIFHEEIRSSYIPNYSFIKKTAKSLGAYGSYISGSGPTMISFVPISNSANILKNMRHLLKNYQVEKINIDDQGLVLKH